ncbi:MAG: signal recognition particle-docking protein FtsY [Polyangiaceae bacterium]
MTTFLIVLVIAALAIGGYFVLGRKPPELQPAPEDKEPPKKKLPPPAPPITAKLGAPTSTPTPGEALKLPPPADERPAKKAARARSKRDVAGMKKGLAATRGGFMARLSALFTGKKEIDPAILEEIEEVLLTSDVGVKTTQTIIERLREQLSKNELSDSDAVWKALRAEASRILEAPTHAGGGETGGLRLEQKPTVVLMVGVNGVGKTTTIGKLATKLKSEKKGVILAAGDTFRAAAVQQLEVWAERTGSQIVKGKEGGDPGAVAFDATTKAAADPTCDVLFIDTAGRLHTKAPLMDEIKKVKKSIDKAMPGAPHETLLVLDATTGQNALNQAALFKEAVDLTGIVLTKLDGTAKGGIVLAIADALQIPVRYVGLGEKADDLREFYADEFVEALFSREEEATSAISADDTRALA